MSLLAFLLACGAGALLGLAARPFARVGRLVGIVSLLVAFVAALLIGPNTSVTIGNVTLSGSEYSGLFLACAAASGLLLGVVALASGWPDEFAPAALASFAGLAVATTAADPSVALAAGAAAATAGALVIVQAAPRSSRADGRLAEIRTIGLVAAGLSLAAIAILRPPWTSPSSDKVFALAFLGLGLALAVRSGAVPFHVPAARMRATAAPLAPALLLVWIPAGLGLLAVSWSATTFGTADDSLRGAVTVVQVVAVATLVLGALAALVHDEIEEVAAYSIVADAAFVLLALTARTDAAAEPARLWLLAFVAAKTGLLAWAAALSRAYGTSNVPRLHGWLRRTPLLGIALVAIAIATLGWPGSPVYEARSNLIRLALPGQLQFLFVGSIMLSVACYGRLLVVGALSPTEDVRAARSELPRWAVRPAHPQRSLSAAAAASAESAAGTSDATAAARAGDATDAGSVPARKKSPGSRAAAAVAPTITATATNATSTTGPGAVPVSAATAASSSGDAAASAASGSTPDSIPSTEPPPPIGARRRLAVVWRLNRTLEVSLVVVAGAALAAALAFGNFGATRASEFGIPLDEAAHATPTLAPTPTVPGPSPTPSPTPQPTLAPRPSSGPSGSLAPGESAGPSPSAEPIKTSGPARGNTD